ncbi:hypothetical protein O5584_14430 [Escherichia coli]|nr:hypothetical protein [Escherichia coli]
MSLIRKKDMASFCGQGLAAWRYTKPVLVAEINSLANQLQITIPGCPVFAGMKLPEGAVVTE